MKIKICPCISEIQLTGNIASTDFNGMHLEYTMPKKAYLGHNPQELKEALRQAIAFASKTWQVEYALNSYFGWNGKLKVTTL